MKVSIVITSYNIEEYLKDCLDSVLAQNYQDFDVFIVDDKSTDKSKEIIKSYCKKDKRFNLIENKVNVGAGAARRIGITAAIQHSDSEYIILLDGDDWLSQDFLEALVKEAERTGADIVSGGITIRHSNGIVDTTSYGNCITEGPDKVSKFWGERIVFMNNKLIRKSIHQQVPYCTRRYIEDTPVIIPQLYYANIVAYVDNVGYNYRMRDNSLTHEANPVKNAIYRAICAKELIDFFADKPEYSKWINLNAAFTRELQILKNCNLTQEMIQPYLEDFGTLGILLINDLNI